MSVCLSVSVSKISQNILNRSTSFFDAGLLIPVTQGGNHSILKKKCLGIRVGVGGGVQIFAANDKRWEKN